MTEILILSSKNYENASTTNYGDCILINTGSELVIYDCGHEAHADAVIDYMAQNGFDKAKLILSHNDSDHFDGILKLLSEDKLSVIRTTLLLKYKDIILKKIDDKRKSRDSISQQILDLYDNIAQLSGAPLEDIYEHPEDLCDEVSIVGPDFDYMIETVAKRLDGREGDMMDGETEVNATSIQAKVKIGTHNLLLCGDCSFPAIDNIVRDYDAVQLPHHGKCKQAEKIFDKKSDQTYSVYIVSDNTGNTNGGSDNLITTGHRVYNTKTAGNVTINNSTFSSSAVKTGRVLGI
ncbi:MBL fold metallo-hydrolase [Eisenbergiella tayi]|uniref:MBL fold metallo-hydrolase n=1 Tax=Eisenbergiella tayi TaxID=1432052 RepID=UPI000848A7C9|nr:MBL fold metallo-hydrolase [Eisenbergiella tayi]ODR33774.1 hypothetical protein BEI60_22985 [Eisenbergiella tayi]